MILLTSLDMNAVLNSILFSLIGIVILVLSFIIVEKSTPNHNLWKEIVENKNSALAIVAGFFMLAVAIIIASAIH
jgi:putative membrane protein